MTATLLKLNPNDWPSDKPPLVKPMAYQLVFVKHTLKKLHSNGGKAILWFRIIDPGEFHGIILARYYNTDWVKPKSGEFKAGWKSDLMREFALCHGAPKRADRIPLSRYKDGIYKGKIETVKFARNRPIPPDLQYSVIRSILEKVS